MSRLWPIAALLAAATLLPPLAAAAELRAGRAKVVITPPVGAVIGNSYGISVSTGVSSDLHAKAVVFEVNGVKAAIVACDLISLHRPIVTKARALIAERTGIAPDHVILAATHCHAGPQTHPPLYTLVADENARQLSAAYVERLPGLIAESVRLAEADLQPARLSAGRGREDTISFNRRYLLKNGTVTMGARPSDVVRRAGPIDPEVGVVYVDSPTGTPLVTIVNFALHVAIVTGPKFSADYPHTVSEALRRVKGDGMLTIFLNGTSGNINHVDVLRTSPRLNGEPEAARVGTVLAAAVLKTYHALQPIDAAQLRVVTRPVRVPTLPAPSAERVTEAQAVLKRWGQGAAFTDVIHAWRDLDLAQYSHDGLWDSEVQAITFARDLALVGYPGDSFVEMGLFIKENSPYAFTFVTEQSANGSVGYIPNEKAFPEKAYEVESSRLAPGGGEMLATAASRLLTELFPRP